MCVYEREREREDGTDIQIKERDTGGREAFAVRERMRV